MVVMREFINFRTFRYLIVMYYTINVFNVISAEDIVEEKLTGQRSALDMYKKLFSEHRITQLEAVKSIQKFGDYTYRYKLVDITLKQLFTILNQAKENLTLWGYVPGDEFPQNETIKEGVSKVLENTAMFGDLVLRLPDVVHDIYDKNKDWQLLMGWSYWFCKESEVFEGASAKLLHLMAQEIQLIPQEKDYVNPFKLETQLKRQKEKDSEKLKKQNIKTTKKKKERPKGPRLSGVRNEL